VAVADGAEISTWRGVEYWLCTFPDHVPTQESVVFVSESYGVSMPSRHGDVLCGGGVACHTTLTGPVYQPVPQSPV
jgi:hypothetical protein